MDQFRIFAVFFFVFVLFCFSAAAAATAKNRMGGARALLRHIRSALLRHSMIFALF
jgi:uncharacterized membrane protein